MRDVQKGATLADGGTGCVPQHNFLPFQKRKGNKGMVGMLLDTFDIRIQTFCAKLTLVPIPYEIDHIRYLLVRYLRFIKGRHNPFAASDLLSYLSIAEFIKESILPQ